MVAFGVLASKAGHILKPFAGAIAAAALSRIGTKSNNNRRNFQGPGEQHIHYHLNRATNQLNHL